MRDLANILDTFEPVSLAEMDNVKLMDRFDSKFTFRIDHLPRVLEEMKPYYRVLEVGGVRASRYETLYFDTNSLLLYSRHHTGKFTRYKVRYRKYVDSDLCFFEIKAKNNKGRTIKKRIERKSVESAIAGEPEELLNTETKLCAKDLKAMIQVNFTRLTFVSKACPERLTIDLQLSYKNEVSAVSFPKLVIAEVKRERSSASSPFIKVMRACKIWEGSMSKYCFGIVNLFPRVKMNLFKERIRQIRQLAVA